MDVTIEKYLAKIKAQISKSPAWITLEPKPNEAVLNYLILMYGPEEMVSGTSLRERKTNAAAELGLRVAPSVYDDGFSLVFKRFFEALRAPLLKQKAYLLEAIEQAEDEFRRPLLVEKDGTTGDMPEDDRVKTIAARRKNLTETYAYQSDIDRINETIFKGDKHAEEMMDFEAQAQKYNLVGVAETFAARFHEKRDVYIPIPHHAGILNLTSTGGAPARSREQIDLEEIVLDRVELAPRPKREPPDPRGKHKIPQPSGKPRVQAPKKPSGPSSKR